MKPTVPLFFGVVLAAALGCSGTERAAPAAAPAATTAAPPPAAAPPAVAAAPAAAIPPPAAAAATASAPPKPSAPAPLATSEGSIDGLRVEVTELKRGAGETLSLRFTIVNGSSRPLHAGEFVGASNQTLITAADGAAYTIGGVHLIDLEGKKKYFVARDSAGACVCSKFSGLDPGDRGNHWARFAAPPDSVERLTVVIPPFAPMDSVPVSR